MGGSIVPGHSEVEAAIGAALEARDYDRALTLAIRRYGGEILGFIEMRLRGPGEAREAFAWFAEDLWRSLSSFDRQCSMRTWSYILARRASARFAEREIKPRKRAVPLSRVSRLSLLIVEEGTGDATPQFEERVARLRAQLGEEEQALLTLRVDRELSWKDVARILLPEGAPDDEQALERESLRLRQRFHVLKAKLRELAREEP